MSPAIGRQILYHSHQGSPVWQFLKKLNMYQPSDPAIPPLRHFPKTWKHYIYTKTMTWMFTVALLAIAKQGSNKWMDRVEYCCSSSCLETLSKLTFVWRPLGSSTRAREHPLRSILPPLDGCWVAPPMPLLCGDLSLDTNVMGLATSASSWEVRTHPTVRTPVLRDH